MKVLIASIICISIGILGSYFVYNMSNELWPSVAVGILIVSILEKLTYSIFGDEWVEKEKKAEEQKRKEKEQWKQKEQQRQQEEERLREAAFQFFQKEQQRQQEEERLREEAFRFWQEQQRQQEEQRRQQEAYRRQYEQQRRQEEQRRSQEQQRESSKSVEDRYHEILGTKPGMSFDEIKKAYHQKVMQYHPDKVSQLGEKLRKVAEEEMKKINEAYNYFEKKYQ